MYLLWIAINSVVLIYFAASCIYAIQVIWQRLGRWPLLVLMLGLYAWGSSAQKPVANMRTAPPEAPLVVHVGVPTHLNVSIENHYLNELALATTYWEQSDTTTRLPGQVFTGFRLGNTWHCQLADVKIKDKHLIYNMYGTMDWRLLGVTLYQEPKHLQGVVPL